MNTTAAVGATLFRDAHWRCVWFDPIAAVFVHDSATEAVRQHPVDFAARHFRPDPPSQSRSIPELTASARHCAVHQSDRPDERDLARPLAWLGLDDARRILRAEPDSAEGWKRSARSSYPGTGAGIASRVFDSPSIRSSTCRSSGPPMPCGTAGSCRRATSPRSECSTSRYEQRLMYEAAVPTDRAVAVAISDQPAPGERPGKARTKLAEYRQKLGTPPPSSWRNLAELERIVPTMLARAGPRARRTSSSRATRRSETLEVLDRIATLRLHLGEPARARALWQKAASGPESAVAKARIGATYLVEGDFEPARRAYREAIQARPDLFEARYSLAVLEQDAGRCGRVLRAGTEGHRGGPERSVTGGRPDHRRRRRAGSRGSPGDAAATDRTRAITLTSWRGGPVSPGRSSSRCGATSAPRRSLRRGPRRNPSGA